MPNFKERARELRRNQSDAEALFWSKIRNRQLAGHKFRRQHSIGAYNVDFFCPDRKLVIELDGCRHMAGQERIK